MALYDALFEFSDEQDISQAQGSVISTNGIDFQSADLEMGAGEPLYLNVRIGNEAVAEVDGATNGACTLVVSLVHDGTALDTSSIVTYATRALVETELTAGAWVMRMALPYNVDEERYVGVLYTIGGATSAKGTINAWLDHGPQSSYNTQVST